MRVFLPFALLVAGCCLCSGCATAFAKRATVATGMCTGKTVAVTDVEDAGPSMSWRAGCVNSIGSFRCIAFKGSSDSYDVTCEYKPVCGNDKHQETLQATVKR